MARQDAKQRALDLTEELTRVAERIIGVSVVAQILHGSLATDDYTPDQSDLDILVIVREPLKDEAKSLLADAVTDLARRRDAWVDYRVVTSDSALRPQREPTLDLSVGRHPGLTGDVEVERGPVPEPDLLFEFAICREQGISLVGTPPPQLIGSVPNEWLLDVGDAYLERWQEIDYDDRAADLMVFTACRLWYRYVEGGHVTKSDAAKWVLRQDPELVAPRRALERRTSNTSTVLPEAEVRTLLTTVREVLAGRT